MNYQQNNKNKLVLTAFILFLILPFVYAWDDCPLELENDSYPGVCNLYIDTNHDGICDHSEEYATPAKLNSTSTAEIQSNQILKTNYYFLPIIIILTIIYLLTWIMSKKEIISSIAHKKFWNILLTISFIITAITSIRYILMLEYKLAIDNISFLNFIHIEAGLIMIVISIFHVMWHLNYYKCLFIFKKKECKNEKKN